METGCESCHRQDVPLRCGLLSLAMIPTRKSNVQCCFAPSAVRVVCAPARLQSSDPIIAEHRCHWPFPAQRRLAQRWRFVVACAPSAHRWWFEMDSVPIGLHLLFSVERPDRLFERVGGGAVEIVRPLPPPDPDGVPTNSHVPECEAQGAAGGTRYRENPIRTGAEAIPERSVHVVWQDVAGDRGHGRSLCQVTGCIIVIHRRLPHDQQPGAGRAGGSRSRVSGGLAVLLALLRQAALATATPLGMVADDSTGGLSRRRSIACSEDSR
jgi:hypothetical protein